MARPVRAAAASFGTRPADIDARRVFVSDL
jgi:hypothetical protein